MSLQLSDDFKSFPTLSVSVLILWETISKQCRDGHWSLNDSASGVAPEPYLSGFTCSQVTWRSCSGARLDSLHLGGLWDSVSLSTQRMLLGPLLEQQGSRQSTFRLFSHECLPKCLKLAMVLPFTRLLWHKYDQLQAAEFPHPLPQSHPHSYAGCTYGCYPLPALLPTPPVFSFLSTWHLALFPSVFPRLTPAQGEFSDRFCFWEALQARGRKSGQSWTEQCVPA